MFITSLSNVLTLIHPRNIKTVAVIVPFPFSLYCIKFCPCLKLHRKNNKKNYEEYFSYTYFALYALTLVLLSPIRTYLSHAVTLLINKLEIQKLCFMHS